MDISELYNKYLNSTGVSTDTRKIKNGDIYFALKGDNFNGNHFAQDALANGANAVVVDEDIKHVEGHVFRVTDVLVSLQKLARYHRDQFDIPVLAITGSNGKTTTKELITTVLRTRYKVHFTLGNYNNHIGVPLTILAMPKDTEIAIIEMGANHIGEIAKLCTIANPNYGIITNIGKAHLEGFGSIEGIKKGKSELYQHVEETSGVFFYNEEDSILKSIIDSKHVKLKMPKLLSTSGFLEFYYQKHKFNTNLFGKYNLANAAAAIGIGEYFELKLSDIKNAIESYKPTNNRSQLIDFHGAKVILDAYNANPNSMIQSLKSFNALEGKKLAIIGSMKELGVYEKEEHQSLITYLKSSGIEKIVLVGKEFELMDLNERFTYFDKIEMIGNQTFLQYCNNFDFIILKGSRSNRLEFLLHSQEQLP